MGEIEILVERREKIMDYEIKISESGKYIIAEFFTDMTVTIGKKSSDEAQVLAEKHNIKGFLSDLRNSRNREKIDDNIAFATKDIPDVRESAFEKIALLLSPGDNSHNMIYVSTSNAGYNVRMFTDKQEAIDWLEESK